MGKIKLLDELTIQKIAAGEVIERPSSIVKELVENSLDANSTSIVIEISNGGKTYIRVTDNGDGIDEEDIELAFIRHSTSKLNVIEDLNNILTLGFRGEALSSISAVSKMELITKTENSNIGRKLIIQGGNIVSNDKIGAPKGTTMIVKDLFYNLPVRRKFLKSNLSESNSIGDIVNKLALGNYDKSFKYIKDDKVILNTNANKDKIQNIYTILGKDITTALIPIELNTDDINISGFISNNNLYRSNRSHQYIFINGRYIVNNAIANAIEYHYKSLIPGNRFPVFILYIDIDPSEIDVNIHPTKQEIKIFNKDKFIGTISNIVKEGLYKSLHISKFEVYKEKEEKETIKPIYNNSIKDNLIVKDYSNFSLVKDAEAFSGDLIVTKNVPDLNHTFLDKNINFKGQNEEIIEEFDDEEDIKKILPEIRAISIVFGTYILGESKKKDKLFIVDQHAAHERVMYEKLYEEFQNEKIYTQQLISPIIIDVTDSELNNFDRNRSLFNRLGFEIDRFGSKSLAIRSVPLIFGQPDVKNLFIDLLDNLDKEISSSYDFKLDKLMKLACTNAVKSGDKIHKIEIDSLLKELSKCTTPYTCPHGRPTILQITKKDLEKHFLRI